MTLNTANRRITKYIEKLAGIILIGAGGYIVARSAEDIVGVTGGIGTAAITIGVIVTVVSFMGCFGAANEKGVLLKTYFAFLLILIILEIGVGSAAYAKRDAVSYNVF